MPCRGPEPWEVDNQRRAEQKLEINELTRLLCKATAQLDKNGLLGTRSELARWKRNHDEVDRKRLAKEAEDKAIKATAADIAAQIGDVLKDASPKLKREIQSQLRAL